MYDHFAATRLDSLKSQKFASISMREVSANSKLVREIIEFSPDTRAECSCNLNSCILRLVKR